MGLKLELAVGKVLISKICMLTISENFLSYETEIKFIPFKDCDSNDYITSKSNNNIIFLPVVSVSPVSSATKPLAAFADHSLGRGMTSLAKVKSHLSKKKRKPT